ncbi:expressed unknown protein [Seminavis robusta]|uniref:Uncharacterized protein n=1 Tax=Seminavis robusta TaxID=568900 RepID=A0A9N8H991_9STRA|nr:expressed unknown protein [Seminavis robusta]|eukprot:Sro247_g097940.1 n/a (456) ;mRNA; r:2581-4128
MARTRSNKKQKKKDRSSSCPVAHKFLPFLVLVALLFGSIGGNSHTVQQFLDVASGYYRNVTIAVDYDDSIVLHDKNTSVQGTGTMKDTTKKLLEVEPGAAHTSPTLKPNMQEATQQQDMHRPGTPLQTAELSSSFNTTIAFAVTVTSCPNMETDNDPIPLWDAAAVLQQSIRQTQGRPFDLHVFVHSSARKCGRKILAKLGYQVHILPTPVALEEIQNAVAFSGLVADKKLDNPCSSWPIQAFFTRDYNLARSSKTNLPDIKRVGVQGGFWMVKPNQTVYHQLVDIIRHGANFTKGYGWGGPTLGDPSWYYGIAQMQGLLSYYYGYVAPGTAVELDRCVVNAMADAPNPLFCGNNEAHYCHDCRRTLLEHIYSVHFTICQKPWWCYTNEDDNPLCLQLHHEWHRLRHDWEQNITAARAGFTTNNVQTYRQLILKFPTHCHGRESYIPLKQQQQQI